MSKRVLLGMLVSAILVTAAACQRGVGQVEGNGQVIAGPAAPVGYGSPLLQGLMDDLRLLELLNRLQLSAEQINKILPIVEKLGQQRGAAQVEAGRIQEDLVKALAEKRQLLIADKPAPQELEQRIAGLRNQFQQKMEQSAERLAESAKGLRPLFTAPQLEIVTGRYESRLQARELLDWLRGLSDSDFTEEAAANAEGLADPEKGLDEEALQKLFASARKMSAAEYEKAREELAAKIAPLYSIGEDEENRQISEAFSHPHMADLLREKLQVMGDLAG